MSYTNETTHYAIPKPLGTDLTVPMDYNDAADAVDQALFDATTNASEAVTAAANAVEAAAGAVSDVGTLGTEVNSLKGRTSALETSDVIQNNKIDALENQGVTKFDSAGIADPYVNGLTYSVGDVVTYNGQRYKCTTAVVAAEPFDADKWSAEDVETVLNVLKSDLTEKVDKSKTADIVVDHTGKDLGTLAYNLLIQLDFSKVTPFSYAKSGAAIYRPTLLTNTKLLLTHVELLSGGLYIASLNCEASNNHAYQVDGTSYSDISALQASQDLEFYY